MYSNITSFLRILFRLSIMLNIIIQSCGLIAYDCSGAKSQITEVSLVDTDLCSQEFKNISTKEVEIQLIQPLIFKEIQYIQCQIEIEHLMFRCGKTIDTFAESSFYEELFELGEKECGILIKERFFNYNGIRIYIPKSTDLIYLSLETLGSIKAGSCTPGADTVFNGLLYERPVRTSKFKIGIKKGVGSVDIEENKFITEDGSRCKYSDGYCLVSSGGYTYWDSYYKEESCGENKYVAIFEGHATEVMEINNNKSIVSYILHYEDYDFQLFITGKKSIICGSLIYLTEHPKLSIMIRQDTLSFPIKFDKKKLGKNISLMTYVNSKLVYTTNHIKEQIETLYKKLMYSKCLSETKLIHSILSSAMYSPHDFAYQYFNEEGYTASVRGEVVYIMKCEAVSVNYTSIPGECYQEIPVLRNSKNYFMSPRSRLLSLIGTKVECSTILPVKYKFQDTWYQVSSFGLSKTTEPKVMKIADNSKWEFIELSHLATTGIYSQEDLDKIDKIILTSVRAEAITSQVVRAISGDGKLSDNLNVGNLMTPADLEKFGKSKFHSFLDGFWETMGSFGTFISSLIGVLVLIKVIIFSLNALINVRILWQLFGFSWRLLFFWWSHLVNLILHNSTKSQKSDKSTEILSKLNGTQYSRKDKHLNINCSDKESFELSEQEKLMIFNV